MGASKVEVQPVFTLAGLKVTPRPWEKLENLDRLERFTREAAAGGADVVATPEGFLEGYLWNDDNPKDFSREQYFEAGESIDGPAITRVRELAQSLKIYLLLGFAERRDDRVFNTAIAISPDGDVVSRYSKTHTADDEPFNTKGTDFPVVDTPLGRWGTLICMDRQLPETARILAIKGAQMIFVPAWGMHGEMNDVLMRTRAYENGVHVAFVHPKRCLVIAPDGNVIAQDSGVGSGDEVVLARVALRASGSRSAIRHRRPEIYGDLLQPR